VDRQRGNNTAPRRAVRWHLVYHRSDWSLSCRGRKYKRLKGNKSVDDWTEKYRPFLLPSVNFPNMLFCALTNHVIRKKKEVVEEHLKGRKFKAAQGTTTNNDDDDNDVE
jgi:hypothetical protein